MRAWTRLIAEDNRIYWVCPLVEESALVDLAAAEERFKVLAAQFPGKVGLVHGRLKPAERDAVMADFKSGAIAILVSTTVIEVGVDVPEASVMVIENAERFGLAQLHQLRGRVGRGAAKSRVSCFISEPLGETAKARLKIMRETEDGFRIAEEDLRLRGAGEMLGTRQSGLPLFRMADLAAHGELLAAARDDAALVLTRDPALVSRRAARRSGCCSISSSATRRSGCFRPARFAARFHRRAGGPPAVPISAGSGLPGNTSPIEITIFRPSSTVMSRILTSSASAKKT